MLGNIRFIGELFKLCMLTESIMHNCIMSLFKARDEDSLECLCRLLTTIGQGLDHEKGQVCEYNISVGVRLLASNSTSYLVAVVNLWCQDRFSICYCKKKLHVIHVLL